ncbi:hypothetical protein UlMin_038147 [Ulmus minor]
MLFWPTLALFFLCLTSSLEARSNAHTKHRREVIADRHGVVATDDGRCSRIGMVVLREGGHVVDATVAATLCLGVVSPASSGIGGEAFLLMRLAIGEQQALDMRETAPFLAFENMYAGNATLKSKGALSIAVPREIAGLHKAWKQHRRLPWARLVRPAESLACLGFKVSAYLRMQMERTKSGILVNEGLPSVLTSNGKLLQKGDICCNKKLAETLRRISDFGLEIFYNGTVGLDLVRDIKKAGGILTMKDLQTYQMLNILAQYRLPSGVTGSLGVHRKIEALKHAYAVRMNLGDPDFVNISPNFAKELKKTINDSMTFDPGHYGGKWNQIHDHGTSHLSIIDDQGNAVSMTTTVNAYFGSQTLSPSIGIVLNNEMDDFSIPMNVSAGVLPPALVNFIRSGKRPLSSMSPTIVLKDNQLKAVVGASGGGNIFAATSEVLLNYFAIGKSPFSSVMTPRIHHQLIPNVVNYENWTTLYNDHFEVAASIREALRKKGHVLTGLAGGTIIQFIVQETDSLQGNKHLRKLIAVSDPRKGSFLQVFEIIERFYRNNFLSFFSMV